MYLQMERTEARGGRFVQVYARRLLVLLGFGLAHMLLLWYGDILTIYAVLGWLLLVLRKRSTALVLAFCAAVYFLPLIHIVRQAAISGSAATAAAQPAAEDEQATTPGQDGGLAVDDVGDEVTDEASSEVNFDTVEAGDAMTRAEVERIIRVYSSGTFGEILRQRVRDEQTSLYSVSTMLPVILTMFLLGLVAGRCRLLHEAAAHRRLWWTLVVVGLPAGAVLNMAYATLFDRAQAQGWLWQLQVPVQAAYQVGMPLLSFGYVAAIVLLLQRETWQQLLNPFASVGRMALTNYLLQTLVCTTIFYSYGLGEYGRVGPLAGLLLSLTIYAVQVPLSLVWLHYFRFGPAEWLWRTLTYLRIQPLRRPRERRLPPATHGFIT
jgi:uncharacterized protein